MTHDRRNGKPLRSYKAVPNNFGSIYGSDTGGRGFSSQLSKVLGARIPDAAKKLILGENLRRLLAPILRAKGYQI